MGDQWGAPVVSTPGAIHRDSGCVSAGIQHNGPGQHRLGAGTACRAGAQSVTSVTALQMLKLQRSCVGAVRKHRLVTCCVRVAEWESGVVGGQARVSTKPGAIHIDGSRVWRPGLGWTGCTLR